MDFYADIVSELTTYFHSINSKIKIEKLAPSIPAKFLDTEKTTERKRRETQYRASRLIERLITFRRKHILPCKRDAFISTELQEKLRSDEYIQFASIVETIQDDLRNGNDINGRLSKKADRPSQNDVMLFEWCLYHLHLGKEMEPPPSKYYERTGNLLIVYIPKIDAPAYLIDVSENHYNNDVAFARRRYLEIIENNWPELLLEYEMHGITLGHSLTDEERCNLRSHHGTTINEINGKAISNPGLGITGAGTSILHTMHADYFMNIIDQLEKQCRELQKEYVPQQILEYKNYKLKFNCDAWEFYLVEFEPQREPKIVSIIPL